MYCTAMDSFSSSQVRYLCRKSESRSNSSDVMREQVTTKQRMTKKQKQ